MHSRYEIHLENYKKTVNIESHLTVQIAQRQILPAALRYQAEVASTIAQLKAAGVAAPKGQTNLLNELSSTIEELQTGIDTLAHAIDHAGDGDTLSHAKHARDTVLPAMISVRTAGDKLETLVADDLWPLPTYQEMLFIK